MDEGLALDVFYRDADGDGFGAGEPVSACAQPAGHVRQGGDCDDGDAAAAPGAAEVCDGSDDDCDGAPDDGFVCVLGATVSCTTSCGTTGAGACTSACEPPGAGACMPPAEACNGSDDDCDGAPDDGFVCVRGATVSCTTSCGTTGTGTCTSACEPPAASACTPPAESCNGRDDDCDGAPDDGFACVQGATASCTTSCGSTGSALCGASCTPVGTCTPPAESCNDRDDDCDGLVDEGVRALGPRRDLGTTNGRVVAVATSSGSVVFSSQPSGIIAQRFDRTGAPVGAQVTVSAIDTPAFDAWSTGTRVVVTWLASANLRAMVLDESLTPVTAATTLTATGDLATRVAVAATSTTALFVYHDGTHIYGLARSLPSLGGSSLAFAVANFGRPDFEVATDGSSRAFVGYVDNSNDIRVQSVLMSGAGSLDRGLAITADTTVQRAPSVAFGTDPSTGVRKLGIAFHHNPAGTFDDRLRLSIVDVALDGTMVVRDTVDASSSAPPDVATAPVGVAFAGGRWWVPWLRVSGTSSTWHYAEVRERAGMPPSVMTTTIETGAADNREVTATSLGTTGGGLLFVASRATGGTGRAYPLACR
ncbi:MAG: hypothetical protein OHK0013_32240 [Sandaracinaceae bacterium]